MTDDDEYDWSPLEQRLEASFAYTSEKMPPGSIRVFAWRADDPLCPAREKPNITKSGDGFFVAASTSLREMVDDTIDMLQQGDGGPVDAEDVEPIIRELRLAADRLEARIKRG